MDRNKKRYNTKRTKRRMMKTIDIHGKPYVMVKDRVIKFHEDYPNGAINTELSELPDRYKCRCVVTPDVENPKRTFTGHAVEIIASSKINELSAAECSETSAIGRGLAALGIGVEHEYASGDEVANAINQQNQGITRAHAEKTVESQKVSKTAENGVKCPVCGGSMYDNKEIDGQPKKSHNYDKLVAENKVRGLYQPLYKCSNDKCGNSIWDEPQVSTEDLFNEI